MVIDIISMLGHNPPENKLIIIIKNHKPLKGEKGHWKGEKGEER